MNFSLKSPGGNQAWNAVLLMILGVAWFVTATLSRKPIFFVFGIFPILAGLGLWIRKPWGVWLAMIALTLLEIFHVRRWLDGQHGWNYAVVILFTPWFAWRVWKEDGEHFEVPADDAPSVAPEPLVSFVLLLKGPRRMEPARLSACLSKAWGGSYPSDGNDETPTFVSGKPPIFVVKSTNALYMVYDIERPYSEEAAKTAESIPDLRLRKAVQDHQAWMAVDLMHPFDATRTPESFYPDIAKLIAELAGDDCLAIFQPATGRINAWNPELLEALRGPDPLKDFAVPVNPPVFSVNDDDPAMKSAVAEARRRYPEFVDAWRTKSGEKFAVKAPISAGGRREHLWISVETLRDDGIDGTLGNQPVDLGGLKLGDRVEVPMADVEDWGYFRNGEPIGLFTSRLIAELQRARKSGPPVA